MTTGDSIGRVQLDIEIPQQSVEREASRAGSAMQRTLGRSLNATRSAITNLFFGLSRAGKAGADNMDSIREKAALLNREMENINDQIGIQEAKLARLREQYQYMSELGMSEDPRALKVQEQIAKAEASIIRLTKASDKTANALWEVDDALTQTGNTSEEAAGQIGASGKHVEKTFTRMGRSATGMSNTIRRAFGQVMRRVFLFALIYRGLRSLQDYMGGALKTNAQYARSLGIIRTNLAVAFQPIYKAALPAINALMSGLARATTYIAAFFSALGGKSYRESLEAAKQLEEARRAMDGYGNSAKETRKALMGFDEINVLGAPSAHDVPQLPEFIVPDTAEAEANASRLTEILQPTITSLSNLWEAVKPFKNTIGQGLQDFWKNTIAPFGEWEGTEKVPN